MSTLFHVGTYLQMGDDFDSRNRFLRQAADGSYDGVIVNGETWSVAVSFPNVNISIGLKFKMNDYAVTIQPGATNPSSPSGVVAKVKT